MTVFEGKHSDRNRAEHKPGFKLFERGEFFINAKNVNQVAFSLIIQ